MHFRDGNAGDIVASMAVMGHSMFVNTGDYSPAPNPQACRRPSGYAVGCRGQRIFNDDLAIDCSNKIAQDPQTDSLTPSIGFFSVGGARLGSFRLDCQKPILTQSKYIKDSQGCRNATLIFRERLKFPLLPKMIVRINFGGGVDERYQYAGQTVYYDGANNTETKFTVKLEGLVEQVRNKKKDIAIVGTIIGVDVGKIVEDLFLNHILPDTNIGYDPTQIDTATGVLIFDDINIKKYTFSKLFTTFAEMASDELNNDSYAWGVDGRGKFFFKKRDLSINKSYVVGYDLNKYDPKPNPDAIINEVTILRKEDTSGSSGWAVAHVASDLTSIALNNVKSEQVHMPGYFSNADCQKVAEQILLKNSQIKLSSKLKNIAIRKPDDFPKLNSTYKVVGSHKNHTEVLHEMDSILGIVKIGAGDTIASINTTSFVSGAGSVEFNSIAGLNDVFIFPVTSDGSVKKISLYLQSGSIGDVLKVGVGLNSWNESTQDISVSIINNFFTYEFEVDFKKIRLLGFQMLKESSQIIVDRVETNVIGSKHDVGNCTRQTVTINEKSASYALDIGPDRKTIVEHFSSLMDFRENIQGATEVE